MESETFWVFSLEQRLGRVWAVALLVSPRKSRNVPPEPWARNDEIRGLLPRALEKNVPVALLGPLLHHAVKEGVHTSRVLS